MTEWQSRIWLAVQVSVTVAFTLWLVTSIDRRTVDVLKAADPVLFALSALLFSSAQIFGGLRLWLLFPNQIGWRDAIATTWIGYFLANFLPGTLGGDVVRVVRLKAQGVGLPAAGGGLLLDRVLNVCMILIFAATTGPHLAGTLSWPNTVWRGLGGALTIAAAVLIVLVFKRPRFSALLQHMGQPWRQLAASPSRIAEVLLLSAANIGVSIAAQWMLARSVGIQLGIFELASVICFVTLLVMLPVSLNGIGLQEGSFVVGLSHLGVGREQALVFALLVRMLIIIASAVGGIFLLQDRVAAAGRVRR